MRAAQIADARKLVDKAEAEKRDLTSDENVEWEKRMKDVDSCEEGIRMAERKEKPEGLESFFTTHPLEEDRIRQARELIAKIPSDRLVGLTEDSRAFQQFKARVKALPPSPPMPK